MGNIFVKNDNIFRSFIFYKQCNRFLLYNVFKSFVFTETSASSQCDLIDPIIWASDLRLVCVQPHPILKLHLFHEK